MTPRLALALLVAGLTTPRAIATARIAPASYHDATERYLFAAALSLAELGAQPTLARLHRILASLGGDHGHALPALHQALHEEAAAHE